ncbi:MAG TPA: aryl-sulfate sulfotransferase [Dehalococcoidia bacterium]|nr:aryl-sulfate sulfotransferase [Dehalococcoidia bacterium]
MLAGAFGFAFGVESTNRFRALTLPLFRIDQAVSRWRFEHRPYPKADPAQINANRFEVTQSDPNLTGRVLVGLRGLNPQYENRVVEVDRSGQVTWEYRMGRLLSNDIRKLPNGHVLIGARDDFRFGDQIADTPWDPARANSWVFEVDEAGKLVRQTPAPVTHHAELLDDGNLLVADANRSLVAEVDPQGNLAWSWYGKDHIPEYKPQTFVNTPPGSFGRQLVHNMYQQFREGYYPGSDWLHVNSAQRLANGDTVMSFRNLDLVIEVNRAGDPVWTYGSLVLKHQHCGWVLPNDHLLVVDNGNGRVIEVDRQTQQIVWEQDGLKFATQGCAYRMPDGNTFITDADNMRAIEVTPNHDIVWQLKILTPATMAPYRIWWSPS